MNGTEHQCTTPFSTVENLGRDQGRPIAGGRRLDSGFKREI